MVGVATGSNRCAARHFRGTCHALSSVSGGGGTVGRGVLVYVVDSPDIMLPSYRNPGRSLRSLLHCL